MKIRYLKIRLFIQKRSTKIKLIHLECSRFLQKDRNGHTWKVNEFQFNQGVRETHKEGSKEKCIRIGWMENKQGRNRQNRRGQTKQRDKGETNGTHLQGSQVSKQEQKTYSDYPWKFWIQTCNVTHVGTALDHKILIQAEQKYDIWIIFNPTCEGVQSGVEV